MSTVDGFEMRTLTVFYKDRLTNVQILLLEKTDIDDLVRDRSSLAADAARAHDESEDARRLADQERAKASEILAKINAKADGEAPPLPSVYLSASKKPGKLDFQT